MGDTIENYLRYSIELLEVLPFIVCEYMWLISISRKNHANNNSNCAIVKNVIFCEFHLGIRKKPQFSTF